MANGIFTVKTNGMEIKGKEVKVVNGNFVDEESGEIVNPKDVVSTFEGQYINFSIKVTEKVEDKFEVPENNEKDEE
jgi:hypothetical protein